MSEVDFNAILDMQAEEIKARPVQPAGTYDFRITKMEPVVSSQKKTNGVEFTARPYNALDGIDADDLKESDAFNRDMRITFWITPDSASMLKEFLVDSVGIEPSGKTLREMMAEAINGTFRGVVTHSPTKSGRLFAEIKQTMRAE